MTEAVATARPFDRSPTVATRRRSLQALLGLSMVLIVLAAPVRADARSDGTLAARPAGEVAGHDAIVAAADGAGRFSSIPEGVLFAVEAAVVIGAIVMGTKGSGVALGIWGGFGVAALVFVFGLEPGAPPVEAILIILSVILAASTMQVAGGIDWMVAMAAKAIRKNPKRVTVVAPLMSFLFCLGAGTGNIVYPLLPVVYDVSYQGKVRPSRPLSMTVVASGVALACSPVSAAMAAMITLTDVAPYNFDMIKVLSVTIPAALIGIVATSLIMGRVGPELEDDPEYQARLADGRLDPASSGSDDELTYTTEGRNAAFTFLAGVLIIVVFGLFKQIRPTVSTEGGGTEPVSVTLIIEMVMFAVAAVMLLLTKPKVKAIPESTVFKAGIVSAIALFGLAWLTDTFISQWEPQIVETIGGWVTDYKYVFFLAIMLVTALTTSQSTATRTIVPIGLAVGLSPGVISAMWAGGFAGVFTLPTNGSQIAAANFDHTGTTKLGTKLLDHSFFLPVVLLGVLTAVPGVILANIVY